MIMLTQNASNIFYASFSWPTKTIIYTFFFFPFKFYEVEATDIAFHSLLFKLVNQFLSSWITVESRVLTRVTESKINFLSKSHST